MQHISMWSRIVCICIDIIRLFTFYRFRIRNVCVCVCVCVDGHSIYSHGVIVNDVINSDPGRLLIWMVFHALLHGTTRPSEFGFIDINKARPFAEKVAAGVPG